MGYILLRASCETDFLVLDASVELIGLFFGVATPRDSRGGVRDKFEG